MIDKQNFRGQGRREQLGPDAMLLLRRRLKHHRLMLTSKLLPSRAMRYR